MITVTNNALQFFETDIKQEIIIYSAGNTGKWVGYFMNLTGVDFSCYLDRDVRHEGALLNGKPIFKPERLSAYKGRSLKIIICAGCYKEICSDLLWLDRKYDFNALCFVPQYTDFVYNDERYNINKFLGYFRRQLITGEPPTVISNDCTDGYIYEALGMMMISPTVNVGFSAEDYIKVCKSPKKYLTKDIEGFTWERIYNQKGIPNDAPVGMLGDIKVHFAHDYDLKKISNKWSIMKEGINWNRMVFILQDGHYQVNSRIIDEFDTLSEKHLYVNLNTLNNVLHDNMVCFKENWLHSRNVVIENHFDLLRWLNE